MFSDSKFKYFFWLPIVIAIVLFLSFGIYLYEIMQSSNEEGVIVRLSNGLVRGRQRKTVFNGKKFYSFQGIPYATPPVGENRFKDPEAPKPWSGVLDASKEYICPQLDFTKKVIGNEDCLYLNVFTPEIAASYSKVYPVIFWIHGGGFTSSSSSENHLGPDYLVEHEVVLVTFNYRLGVFGFLSLPDGDVSGNAGLKDQNFALVWVRDNIHHFSGDPNNVIISGESAGSASVQYHMLSPLSHNLFHGAIMESGSALNPWTFTDRPKSLAFKLGEVTGFTNSTGEVELVNFFRSLSASTLIIKQHQIIKSQDQDQGIEFPFLPTVEPVRKKDAAYFLTDTPKNLLAAGNFTQVPTIIGMNSREGIVVLVTSFWSTQSYGYNFGMFVPASLNLMKGSESYSNVSRLIQDFFYEDRSINVHNLDIFCNVYGDLAFTIGIHQSIKYMVKKSNAPVYSYLFTFEGKLRRLKQQIQTLRSDLVLPSGVCHADEMQYIFRNQEFNYKTYISDTNTLLKVTTMWTNFAKTKNPNDHTSTPYWMPSSEEFPRHLDIGQTLTLKESHPFPERTKFWDEIYSVYSNSE